MEADASGVLLYENILKAADMELSGKEGCGAVAAGHSFPRQSSVAAVGFLGAVGTIRVLPCCSEHRISRRLESIWKACFSTVSAVLKVFWSPGS